MTTSIENITARSSNFKLRHSSLVPNLASIGYHTERAESETRRDIYIYCIYNDIKSRYGFHPEHVSHVPKPSDAQIASSHFKLLGLVMSILKLLAEAIVCKAVN